MKVGLKSVDYILSNVADRRVDRQMDRKERRQTNASKNFFFFLAEVKMNSFPAGNVYAKHNYSQMMITN